jgi:hypothetical protein
MDTAVVVLLLIVLIVLIVLGAFLVSRRRQRSQQLRERFGPEYERTVDEAGDRRAAEKELAERQERRSKLHIVPLAPDARARYSQAWTAAQAKFVDNPAAATREADSLVTSVMRDRGYPIEDFEQRAADVSVDHPEVVEHYRAARAIAKANDNGAATTDDLREAITHYRALFQELLDEGQSDPGPARTDEGGRGSRRLERET